MSPSKAVGFSFTPTADAASLHGAATDIVLNWPEPRAGRAFMARVVLLKAPARGDI